MDKGIIYRGPSQIDGAPIVALAVFTRSNRKTGGMVQTYILRDDVDPITANRTGADTSICGACPLKGVARPDADKGQAEKRACYVTLAHGPLGVYKAFRRGQYPAADTNAARRAIGRGRMVRLGTYGDPAAVPAAVWAELCAGAIGWTGYTHQWRTADRQARRVLATMNMASVESLADAVDAWAAGFRTFRIISDPADMTAGEILCPASAEAGFRSTCEKCGLCQGASSNSRKSIAIVAHGTGKRHMAS